MLPDTTILLKVLGNWGDEVALDALRSLSDADWNDLVQESKRQLVAPLFYRRLKKLEYAIIPPPFVVEQLRNSYLRNSARGVWFMNGLSLILNALHDENISTILYKGIYLAGELYEDVALRPIIDIDILVHEHDLLKAQRCIDETQRRHPIQYPDLDLKTQTSEITSLHNIDMDGVWNRARLVSINGVNTLVLGPEDMFLTLCIHHFFQHAGQLSIGIRIFCDVSAVLDRYQDEIDWEQVELRADEWGVSNCVSLALRLTRDLLNTTVPDKLVEFVTRRDPGEELQFYAANYFSLKQSETLVLSPYLLQLLRPDRVSKKMSYILKTLIPDVGVMAGKMRTSKYSVRLYLGYILRAMRLIWIGFKMLLTLITANIKKRKLIKLIRWMT
jgi:hypothetical protein